MIEEARTMANGPSSHGNDSHVNGFLEVKQEEVVELMMFEEGRQSFNGIFNAVECALCGCYFSLFMIVVD